MRSNVRPASLSFRALLAVVPLVVGACGQVQVEPATAPDTANSNGDTGNGTPGEDASPDVGSPDTVAVGTDATAGEVQGNECVTPFDCLSILPKNPCAPPSCDNGFCVAKKKEVGAACTDATLSPGECGATACNAEGKCALLEKPDGSACGVGACGHKCEKGQCVEASDKDYDDGNPCTKDYCNQGIEVVHDPITDLTAACDDGDKCTAGDACLLGKCKGQAIDCGDGVACTFDTCDKDGCLHVGDAKKCDDGNPCTAQECDLQAGCKVASFVEKAACDDGNACTKDDACAKDGTCTGTATCACVTDADCKADNLCLGLPTCKDNVCVHDPAKAVKCDTSGNTSCLQNQCDKTSGQCQVVPIGDKGACDDGNACTSQSTCADGACVGAPDLGCDDKNPCTSDACSPQSGCVFDPNSAACDDGNACTTGDVCSKGGCGGAAKSCDDNLACTLDACDKTTGQCTHAVNHKACDDKNACTTDSCDATKGCLATPDDKAVCNDGDECTQDTCLAGKCTGKFVCQCKDATGCDDKNPCTVDSCSAGQCKNDPAPQNGKSCDTADKCQQPGSGVCEAGNCKSGNKPIACTPADPQCQTAACNPATGKCESLSKQDGLQCDFDKNGCTQGDKCLAGKCTVGKAADCSVQGGACQDASCKSTGANTYTCEKTPKTAGTACDDGAYCTTSDACDGKGACVGGSTKTCAEAADACNTGACDETKDQCVKTPKASTVGCDDGLYCTTGDHCDGAGKCTGGTALKCPDGNCATGLCDEVGDKCGTKPAAAGSTCTDGNLCTTVDKCDSLGKCVGSSPVTCTGDACNDASCNTATGKCDLKPKTAGTTCDDGQACTSGDKCDSVGKCQAGSFTCQCKADADCNDGNDCTTDKCVNNQCTKTVTAGASCDDKNACSTASTCSSTGACTPTAFFDCSKSKDQCNDAVCDVNNGAPYCKLVPLAATTKCSDNLACTTNDLCNGLGKCVGGPAPSCPAAPTCMVAVCTESAGGCTTQPATKGAACSDGNACTSGEVCDGTGKCAGGANLPDFGVCDDGDKGTSGDFCYANKCAGFFQTSGPAGPTSAIAWQPKLSQFYLTASNTAQAGETSTGDWRIWSLKKGTAGYSAGSLYTTGTAPVAAVSHQVAVGSGAQIWFQPSGTTTWQAPTVSALGKAVAAVVPAADWYAVDSATVGSTLHVALAGFKPSTGLHYMLACNGDQGGAGTYSCLVKSSSGSYRPVGTAVSTFTPFCMVGQPCSQPTVNYDFAAMVKNTSGLATSMLDYHFSTANTNLVAWGGPVVSPNSSLFVGDVMAPSYFGFIPTGTTVFWMVGPSGHVSYQKAGSTAIYAATVASAQSGYSFRAVRSFSGHTLLWGSKPDPSNSANRLPVLLVHKEEIDKQSGTAYWTEIALPSPSWSTTNCPYGNALSPAGLGVAAEGIVGAVNVCANPIASKATVKRTGLFARSLQ